MNRLPFFLITLIALAGCVAEAVAPIVAAQPEQPPAVDQQVDAQSSIVALNGARASCPITPQPETLFTPPAPYRATPPSDDEFWYGDASLWTVLSTHGTWNQLPYDELGYTQKTVWWKDGYDWIADPQPELTVSGRRLDAEAPPLIASRATNGFHEDLQSFMLVGVDIPTEGCWEISGSIDGNELSFVVWVEP